MAIYHFSAKVISRANGSSAVAAAAYRSASELHDQRLGRDHDFSNKAGVIHSEVLLPDGAPEHLSDRTALWNAVEGHEKRKDAQLAREVEFAIPRELTQKQGIELARGFVEEQFVKRGMIADLNVHWDYAKDGTPKPHAHVMLTMREVDGDGFGKKVRDWNAPELLKGWREAWADHANQRLAELGIEARIDHRSFADQGIDLEPQHKIGPAAQRRPEQGLEAERIDDHRSIAWRNGERILAEPEMALAAITRQQATFTTRDLAVFAFRHSDGNEQFQRVVGAVRGSPELVALGRDGRGEQRFTSREMIEVEERLERAAAGLAGAGRHGMADPWRERALEQARARGLELTGEQRDAFRHVTGPAGLSAVVGYAGSGKSAMLGVAREAWESDGYRVRGAALSGIAAENLEGGAGIASRTLASLEHQWAQGREQLAPRDVLVIDEAGMIGTRQLERVLSHASEAGAKVVLVGDPEQLQAIDAGAAFRSVAERHGAMEITQVRRQRHNWQRDATRQLATGRTGVAIGAYEAAGMVRAADTRDGARAELVDAWERDRAAAPNESRVILTHTNAEVRGLNEAVRGRLRAAGELGQEVEVKTERGARSFAAGDRLMFLRNERALGGHYSPAQGVAVKNGTLGTVLAIESGGERLTVRLDGPGQAGKDVTFYTRDYAHFDHGYAATIHKAQGVTVDRAYVLATPGMDRHGAYVALSRHREGVQLHHGRDDFADTPALTRTLSRDRAKDMAGDYAPGQAVEARARVFAERREIHWPERVRALARTAQEKARSVFAGFRPRAEAERAPAVMDVAQVGVRGPEESKTIERFARAVGDIARMKHKGLPVLPHQATALTKAADALDRGGAHASRDMVAAFNRNPELMREAMAGRTAPAVKAMAAERVTRLAAEREAQRHPERAPKVPELQRDIGREPERERNRDRDRGMSR